MILGFPSSVIGFPIFWQCWVDKVHQDAEEEEENVNQIPVPPAIGKEILQNLIHVTLRNSQGIFILILYQVCIWLAGKTTVTVSFLQPSSFSDAK